MVRTEMLDKYNMAHRLQDDDKLYSNTLPIRCFFFIIYVCKEVVRFSMIEGAQASFYEVLLVETDEESKAPVDDVHEVGSYVTAASILPVNFKKVLEIIEKKILNLQRTRQYGVN